MKYLILLVICLALSGCANFRTEYLVNRITCTVAKDKAYVTSLWGIIGISSEIVKEDSDIICSSKSIEVK